MENKLFIFTVVLAIIVQPGHSQSVVSPRISSLGVSLRYSATPVTAALNADTVSQAFQDIILSKFARDVAAAGLDETMYFRLRVGGVGAKSMLRLRRMSLAQVIGHYAEKRLELTDGWKPVSKQNAPQNDLYKIQDGRFVGAQVKTHRNGDPATYARDMFADNRAEMFLIPDDHYDTTLQYLKQQTERARASGDSKNAAFYERQIQRLGKIGASYRQLEAEAQLAAKLALTRAIATRVGWIITGVMVVPSAYNNFDAYYTGKISGNEFAFNLGKDALSVGAGVGGIPLGNTLFKASPWGVGGTVAVFVFSVQEGFLILQYGSFARAFSQPEFWIVTGGNVAGAVIGLAGAIYTGQLGAYLGSGFGPIGTGVGITLGGLLGGVTGAAIGSYGGSAVTRIALEIFAPDWVYSIYDHKIEERLEELRRSLN